ncbi:glycosyltransferase family 2 protein [Verrucomicrobiota bacterium]
MKYNFSIVTPNLNQLQHLKRCCASITNQKDVSVEHIVMDGQSSDGTEEWLRSKSDIKWKSKKDEGMYDAINKGWSRANGEILSWLNADEQYLPGALSVVQEYFNTHPNVDAVFGDYIIVDPEGNPLAARKEIPLRKLYVLHGILYAQSCTIFMRRKIYEQYKGFDTSYKILGDMEWVLRLMGHGVDFVHIPRYLALFTVSTKNLSLNPQAQKERKRIINCYKSYCGYFGKMLTRILRGIEKIINGCYGYHQVKYSYMVDEKQCRQFECKTGSLWIWPKQ